MIYIHTGKVTGSKYCTFGSACFYLSDIPIRDIPYSFLLLRTLMLPLPCNAVLHPGLAGPYKHPRLRRLLHKLSAIICWVLDRICTRLYLIQIARRSANGYRAMQFRILARQGSVNACALARWTHSVFLACGVSCASFLLSVTRCLIEYVHVYTLHKLPGVQTMVTVQCSFAFWPESVV